MKRIDFETFSTAGYDWHPVRQRWVGIEGSGVKSGLPCVGAEVYASHPSTRVICMALDGGEVWREGDPPLASLISYVDDGGILSAFNSAFEWWVWRKVLHERQGWPELPLSQIVDTAPRCRAYSIPGSLGGAAGALGLAQQKDTRGGALIKKFSCPRAPTKSNPALVIMAADDPEAAREFEEYCVQDVVTEGAVADAVPELSEFEFRVWQLDQEINVRGIPVDVDAISNACEILRQADRVLNAEIKHITGGAVDTHGQRAAVMVWCTSQGYTLPGYTSDDVEEALKADPPPPPQVQRVLEIRQALGSTSTRKVWAFKCRELAGRIYGQTIYGGAARTLRWSGSGVQVHNFPRGELPVSIDEHGVCHGAGSDKWRHSAAEQFISELPCRDYLQLAERWGDPLKAMAGSLRGFICAPAGKELIGSDYTAIEAVVLAVLAGEQWRIDVFNGHGKIYESSAAKITGKTLEFYLEHKRRTGEHHPDRNALGKVAELASGYQGGVGAWKNFDGHLFFTPDRCEEYRTRWERYKRKDQYTLQDFAVQCQVWAWREASPNIVALWKGLQDAATDAIRSPGDTFTYRLISYVVEDNVLFCVLPSGRRMAYHKPRIGPGKFGDVIYYWGDSKPLKGKPGWQELNTYGGKLAENVTQAVARDLLAHGLINVATAGYPVIFHVHDEIIAEVDEGWGSVAEFETLMGRMPSWAQGWPVRAAGGWRGKRFRK